jgi:hypothetical protein
MSSSRPLFAILFGLLGGSGCSFPVDDFVTQRAERDDAATDADAPVDAVDAADTRDAPDTAKTCRCIDCPGDSRRCKEYAPAGCGVFNDPC